MANAHRGLPCLRNQTRRLQGEFKALKERRSLTPPIFIFSFGLGSGRLQTVHKETNPRYHALISEFARLTSIPMVLNTSFNENEPVVCYPGQALDCFLRTRMDVLVLGDFYIERGAR